MKPVEFRRQIFRDSLHWDHGLSYKLEPLKSGGFALFSRPTFKGWVLRSDEASSVANLALDHCGRIFWIHRVNCQLYRYDPISLLVESMIPLAERCAGKDQLFSMLSVMRRLWILDRGGSSLIAVRTDTFQIIAEIHLQNPIDIAWSKDRLFVLDRKGIGSYDMNGSRLSPHRSEHLSLPVAIGADPAGDWVYVVDDLASGFLRFRPDGSFHDELGKFNDVASDFVPRLIAVHSRREPFYLRWRVPGYA